MKLTKAQAVEIAGIELVEKAELENCEFTNRVTDGTEWAGYTEFSASAWDDKHIVKAYYFQESDDLDGVEDLSDLCWEVEYYEVEEI